MAGICMKFKDIFSELRRMYPDYSLTVSLYVLSRLSMRSETTRILSYTCWLCRASTPPATHQLWERAMRYCYPSHTANSSQPSHTLTPTHTHTHTHTLVITRLSSRLCPCLQCCRQPHVGLLFSFPRVLFSRCFWIENLLFYFALFICCFYRTEIRASINEVSWGRDKCLFQMFNSLSTCVACRSYCSWRTGWAVWTEGLSRPLLKGLPTLTNTRR